MNDRRLSFRNAGFVAAGVLALALAVGNSLAVEVLSPDAPFSIQRQGRTFSLIKPNGQQFFSLGVGCVNQGASRGELDSANPGYAAWQHYADSNAWAATALVCRVAAKEIFNDRPPGAPLPLCPRLLWPWPFRGR